LLSNLRLVTSDHVTKMAVKPYDRP